MTAQVYARLRIAAHWLRLYTRTVVEVVRLAVASAIRHFAEWARRIAEGLYAVIGHITRLVRRIIRVSTELYFQVESWISQTIAELVVFVWAVRSALLLLLIEFSLVNFALRWPLLWFPAVLLGVVLAFSIFATFRQIPHSTQQPDEPYEAAVANVARWTGYGLRLLLAGVGMLVMVWRTAPEVLPTHFFLGSPQPSFAQEFHEIVVRVGPVAVEIGKVSLIAAAGGVVASLSVIGGMVLIGATLSIPRVSKDVLSWIAFTLMFVLLVLSLFIVSWVQSLHMCRIFDTCNLQMIYRWVGMLVALAVFILTTLRCLKS